MSRQERIDHHAARALAELNAARNASCDEAAEAHLELSELHLRRMQNARQDPPPPTLRLVSERAG